MTKLEMKKPLMVYLHINLVNSLKVMKLGKFA